MDLAAAWIKVGSAAKTARRASATGTVNVLDALTPPCAPFAARWDAEADRRAKLRTPEHLKTLMEAQRTANSARVTAQTAHSQLAVAKKATGPLSGQRRAARAAVKATETRNAEAKRKLKAARKDYPDTLTSVAARAHAVHAVPSALASVVLSLAHHDVTVWPGAVSVSLIGLNAVALWLGRRNAAPVAEVEGATAEERQLMARLDPVYWVQNCEARGLAGTVTTPPALTPAGIACDVRLDGTWTLDKLRSAEAQVRALLGARTALPVMIKAGTRGGWAVITLRTRSAADGANLAWTPGAAFGVDTVTGEDVRIPLGQRMLIAGRSGAGKSWSARPLLYEASAGPENVLVVIDLKRVEAKLWEHRARIATTPEAVIELVAELVAEMLERLDLVPRGEDTITPSAQTPRITVFVDEGAEVVTTAKEALAGLESIARMGRAACVDLWWATQKPTMSGSSAGIPAQIAPQLSTVVSLAVSTPTEARTVLGEDAQAKGWNAEALPAPGYALVRSGPGSKPHPVRTRALSPKQVIALPNERVWHRSGASVPAPDPGSGGRRLTLVKEAPAPAAETPAAVPAAPAPALTESEARVLRALLDATAPQRHRDLVESTGTAKATVSKALAGLIGHGLVVRDGQTYTATSAAGEVSA